MYFLFYLIVFFISKFILNNYLIPYLKKNFPDKPNDRSMHAKTKPRSGGIIFVLFSLLSILFSKIPIFFIALPLSIIGLFDDRKGVSQKIRFLIQIFTVQILLVPAYEGWGLNQNDTLLFIFLYFCLTILGVGIINFINFLDGIDGLVGGCLWVILLSLLISKGYLFLTPLLASLSAFLFFNWYPSKLFMGDVGSTFLGAVFVGFIFESSNFLEAMKILLLAFPLLSDAIYTLVRKILKKQSIFKAHRQHLYQRLTKGGWNHNKVSTIYILLTVLICVGYLFDSISLQILFSIFALILGFYYEKRYAVPLDNDN